MFNYRKLVDILNCSVKTAYNKLYNIDSFTLRDLNLLTHHYNLSYDEIIKELTLTSYNLQKEGRRNETIKKNN